MSTKRRLSRQNKNQTKERKPRPSDGDAESAFYRERMRVKTYQRCGGGYRVIHKSVGDI